MVEMNRHPDIISHQEEGRHHRGHKMIIIGKDMTTEEEMINNKDMTTEGHRHLGGDRMINIHLDR